MENVPLPNSQSFCDGDCQQKMLNAGLLIALVVGIFTSIFLVVTLCKTFYNYTIPNVQEKILFVVTYLFILISWNCLSIPLAGDDFPTLLDAIRRGFQIIAYICFYRMTCNYITPKKTVILLENQVQGRHLFPFTLCFKPYRFNNPQTIEQSLKRIDYFVYQSVVFQVIAGFLDVVHDITVWFDPNNLVASGKSKEWFNLGYLIPEALSLTIGAYFIFLRFSFNKMHYRHTHFKWKFTIFMILIVLANWQWIALEAAKSKIFVTYFQLKGKFTEDHLAVCLNSMLISLELLFCAVFAQIAFNPKEFLNPELRSLTREEETNVIEFSPTSVKSQGPILYSQNESDSVGGYSMKIQHTEEGGMSPENKLIRDRKSKFAKFSEDQDNDTQGDESVDLGAVKGLTIPSSEELEKVKNAHTERQSQQKKKKNLKKVAVSTQEFS